MVGWVWGLSTKISDALTPFEKLISQTQRLLVSGKNLPNRIAVRRWKVVDTASSNRIHRMWQHKLHTWVLNILVILIRMNFLCFANAAKD